MFEIPHLRAQTTPLPDGYEPELAALFLDGEIAWIKDGTGFVAAGEAARYEAPATPSRFALASQWWSRVLADAEIRDELRLPGTGLISVGSFAFNHASPAGSVLIIPQVVVGWDGQTGWLTLIGPTDRDVFDTLSPAARELVDDTLRRRRPPAGEVARVSCAPASTAERADHRSGVVAIQQRIGAGEADKVVLARRLELEASEPIDQRSVVRALAAANPESWTFAVDSLVGATPELLAATKGREVHVRVLAGTAPRERDAKAWLISSTKNTAEHHMSVESVVCALEKLGAVEAGSPFVLELPTVLHLATDIRAHLDLDATSLEVAGALHPTAALGGTPTHAALKIIDEVEGADRGRYGAPVGWMGSHGGEWCVALRCAQIDGTRARAWAGGGILADSDPDTEWAETEAKFAPILDAFNQAE
ncbi:isochorismate synthase [Trueperella bialowiezensis]|uniref:isochorismate synthase n=1 Tax=Trueperella bialowiezensis TaxID=312285 RepID=A0A3S4UZM3_9ACTO|nr:chorismate-binding protein [Trueperella bialowiezensis]VEI13695.1 Isochorismate synthase dhbC [Trueperella bialowiezensis]